MRLIVLLCHPCRNSTVFRLYQQALETLQDAGHDIRARDLYAEGFDPVLRLDEWSDYFETAGQLKKTCGRDVDDLAWAEGLVLVFPTWTYGPPAMLKGWLEKAFLPGTAFTIPGRFGLPMQPTLLNIRYFVCITTGGAPRWLMFWVGNPGRKILLRGMRLLFSPRCKVKWLQLYRMDQATTQDREAFSQRVMRYLKSLPPGKTPVPGQMPGITNSPDAKA